jgi:hypothetical protein
MSPSKKRVPNRPFKGYRVEMAETTYVSAFDAIAEEFMRVIFGMEPEDYLITDESTLRDFLCIFNRDLTSIYRRIQDEYGIGEADLPSLRLHRIFALIQRRRCGEPS